VIGRNAARRTPAGGGELDISFPLPPTTLQVPIVSQNAQIVAECGQCRRRWLFPPQSAGHAVPCPNCRAPVAVNAPPPPALEPDADLSALSDDTVATRPRYRPQSQFPFLLNTLSVMCGVLAALLVSVCVFCALPPVARDVLSIHVTFTK